MDIGQIVIVLIALIITITIGTIIMSNVSSGLDCSSLDTSKTAETATGWQKLCFNTQTQGISAVNLLLIALIIIAAAAIIATVRMIGY